MEGRKKGRKEKKGGRVGGERREGEREGGRKGALKTWFCGNETCIKFCGNQKATRSKGDYAHCYFLTQRKTYWENSVYFLNLRELSFEHLVLEISLE